MVAQDKKPFKLFTCWMEKNRERFPYPFRMVRDKSGYRIIIEGVTSMLEPFFAETGFTVAVRYKGRIWDLLAWADLEIAESRNEAGLYYCEFCLPEHRQFYSTRTELWENHCFEPFLEWAKRHFRPGMWLCLLGQEGHSTEAKIVNEGELGSLRGDDWFLDAVPIIV